MFDKSIRRAVAAYLITMFQFSVGHVRTLIIGQQLFCTLELGDISLKSTYHLVLISPTNRADRRPRATRSSKETELPLLQPLPFYANASRRSEEFPRQRIIPLCPDFISLGHESARSKYRVSSANKANRV